ILKEMCVNKKLDNVDFAGHISDAIKLKGMYEKSDIFILPSFKETFGIVYVEAMASGLPILYSRNQGIDGYFEEGKVGYSIDPYSVKDIEKKLFQVIER
ncbi:glycosyltransferase, partial [Halomonas sp. SIMBA_159]